MLLKLGSVIGSGSSLSKALHLLFRHMSLVKDSKGLHKFLLELCIALCDLVGVIVLVFWGVFQEVAKE